MKRIEICYALLMIIALSCSKNGVNGRVPTCLQQIDEFKASGTPCDDAHVDLYEFQGRNVYVFDPGTCGADMMAPVVDERCKSLGALGGFVGNTKINGEDFSGAKRIREVWRNP